MLFISKHKKMVTKLWLALVAQVPTCIFKLGDFQAVVITATNPYYILYRNFNVLNKRKRCFIRKYETSAFFSFDNNTKTDFQVLIYKRMISIFNSFCADKYFFVLIVKQVFLTKQKRKTDVIWNRLIQTRNITKNIFKSVKCDSI